MEDTLLIFSFHQCAYCVTLGQGGICFLITLSGTQSPCKVYGLLSSIVFGKFLIIIQILFLHHSLSSSLLVFQAHASLYTVLFSMFQSGYFLLTYFPVINSLFSWIHLAVKPMYCALNFSLFNFQFSPFYWNLSYRFKFCGEIHIVNHVLNILITVIFWFTSYDSYIWVTLNCFYLLFFIFVLFLVIPANFLLESWTLYTKNCRDSKWCYLPSEWIHPLLWQAAEGGIQLLLMVLKYSHKFFDTPPFKNRI